MSARQHAEILIVGAGIAGLTLAQAMRRRGLPFEIIERVGRPAPVGAGITLVYNALRLLDALGLGPELRERGQLFDGALIASVGGTPLQQASVTGIRAGAQSLGLHRADLHEVLSRHIDVQWGQCLSAIEVQPQGVQVTLQSGEQRKYALVVGADGLHSQVRQQVFAASPMRYAGYTCWRFATQSPFAADPVEWWGRGRRLGLTNIGGGKTYGYATLNRPAGIPDPPAGRAARLRETFRDFPALADPVLQHLEDHEIGHNDLFEFPQHHWQQSRVALLGDAAHAMTPNLGQGAGMGIEDAVVLAEALNRYGLGDHALQTYQALRQARVRGMADASRLIGWVGQLENPVLRGVRDLSLSLLPAGLSARQLEQRLFNQAPAPPNYIGRS